MRIALAILIGIHGIIHLFGFLKAFEIAQFDAISQPISKTTGIVWLLGFALLVLTAVLFVTHSRYWWVFGGIGILISQFLIINYWSDAKFGTIANLIILLFIVVGYSSFSFQQKIRGERKLLFEHVQSTGQQIVDKEALSDLPPVVQRWLIVSGAVGKPITSSVHLVQKLQLKMKPEQSEWYNGQADQYFTVQPPAFNWSANIRMNNMLTVAGRDKFVDGRGQMTIKLASLIPVANAGNNEKVNQATLQRYLAEIVWFPSAALSPNIKWEMLDDSSATATMEYKGTRGSGDFHFDKEGKFEKFVAMRYKDAKDLQPTEWTVKATKTAARNGIAIPVACEASWKLARGEWTWLKLQITDIDYNLEDPKAQ